LDGFNGHRLTINAGSPWLRKTEEKDATEYLFFDEATKEEAEPNPKLLLPLKLLWSRIRA
jgi:hypothetical protein